MGVIIIGEYVQLKNKTVGGYQKPRIDNSKSSTLSLEKDRNDCTGRDEKKRKVFDPLSRKASQEAKEACLNKLMCDHSAPVRGAAIVNE